MRERWSESVSRRAAMRWNPEQVRELMDGETLPLHPVEAAPLLRALDLMNGDGSIPEGARRKVRQINHLVTVLEPELLAVSPDRAPVRILDAGCGRSALTYLLAWCFTHRWRRPAEILGVDRTEGLIAKCRTRYELTGLPQVARFAAAALEALDVRAAWDREFGHAAGPHAVLALHACDTATDEALALGVASGAELLAVAPCCQVELSRGWAGLADQPGAFAPIWRSPHLRRETAATVTDAMRTLLLRAHGYEVVAMQFVAPDHTPKNTLLRARRRGGRDDAALAEYTALKTATGGIGIRLETLLAG